MKSTQKFEMRAAGTLKSVSSTYWAVHACAENEVFYLIFSSNKKTALWETLDNMKDASDMLLFESKKTVTELVKHLIKTGDYPKSVVNFEISEIIPSYTEDGHWYETINFQDIQIKKGDK